MGCNNNVVLYPVLKDPDSNPYSLLEGEGELADTDIADGVAGERRRRSRRRRNDQEPSVMDAATESDNQAGPSENGMGEQYRHAVYSSFVEKQKCALQISAIKSPTLVDGSRRFDFLVFSFDC